MAARNRVRAIILLLQVLFGVYVDSLDVGGYDFLKTTIAYRKKANTAVKRQCMPPNDLVCSQQDRYCAAFHVGKHFFATAAHCLVGVDGYIQDPDELEIVGLGKVNVSIVLHHKFDNMTGLDVAWIHYKHPEQVPTVRVAKENPINCKMFSLDVFDLTASGIHAGHRWIEGNMFDRIYKVKDPTTGQFHRSKTPYAMFTDKKNIPSVEHILLCTAKDSKREFEVHYIEVGFVERTILTVDCHNARCGYVAPENMVHPVTTTTTTTTPPPPPPPQPPPPPPPPPPEIPVALDDPDPIVEPEPPQPVLSPMMDAPSPVVAQLGPTPKPIVLQPPPISNAVRKATGGKPHWKAGYPSWKAGSQKGLAGYSTWSAGYPKWTTGNSKWSAGHPKWTTVYSKWSAGYPKSTAGYSKWSAGYPSWSPGYSKWSAGNPSLSAGNPGALSHQGNTPGIDGQSNWDAENPPGSAGWPWSNPYEAGPFSHEGNIPGIDGQLKWDAENPSGIAGSPAMGWNDSYAAFLLSHQGNTPGIDGQSNWKDGNPLGSAGGPWRNSHEAGLLSHQGNTPGIGGPLNWEAEKPLLPVGSPAMGWNSWHAKDPLLSEGNSLEIDGHANWEAGNPLGSAGPPVMDWSKSHEAGPLSHQGNIPGIDGQLKWDAGNPSGSAEWPAIDWNNSYATGPLLKEDNTLRIYGQSKWKPGKPSLEFGADNPSWLPGSLSGPTTDNESSIPLQQEDNQNVTYFNQPMKIGFKNHLGRGKTSKSTTKTDIVNSSSPIPVSTESIEDVQEKIYFISHDDEYNVTNDMPLNHSDSDEEEFTESISKYDEYDMDEEIETLDGIFDDHLPSAADDGGCSMGSMRWSTEDYELLGVPITAAPPTMVATTRRKCRKPSPTARKRKPSRIEKAKIKPAPSITTQDVIPKPVEKIRMRDSSAVAIDEVSVLVQTFLSVIFVYILTC